VRLWLLGGCLLTAACARTAAPGPASNATADDQMRALISLRLSSDRRLCPYAIEVRVTGSAVRFEGKVGTTADRRRAEEIAQKSGATRVDDRLGLDPASGDQHRC
jgi:osmotically-inducible protein OsmY